MILIVFYYRMNGLSAEFSTRTIVGSKSPRPQMGYWGLTLLGMICWIFLLSHLSWILHFQTPTSLAMLTVTTSHSKDPPLTSQMTISNSNKTRRCFKCPQTLPTITQFQTRVYILKLRFQINILSTSRPIQSNLAICTKGGVPVLVHQSQAATMDLESMNKVF